MGRREICLFCGVGVVLEVGGLGLTMCRGYPFKSIGYTGTSELQRVSTQPQKPCLGQNVGGHHRWNDGPFPVSVDLVTPKKCPFLLVSVPNSRIGEGSSFHLLSGRMYNACFSIKGVGATITFSIHNIFHFSYVLYGSTWSPFASHAHLCCYFH